MTAGNSIFGKQSAGSPFIVYAPGEYLTLESERKNEKAFEPVRAWHFAVSPGDTLEEQWPLENFKEDEYHLRVYGPNGFFRELTGDIKDPLVKVICGYERKKINQKKTTGNILLKISNLNPSQAYEFEVKDHGYKNKSILKKMAPSQEAIIILDLKKNFGWYDFSLTVNGDHNFSRRYAGRIETGEESFSDPQMGEV